MARPGTARDPRGTSRVERAPTRSLSHDDLCRDEATRPPPRARRRPRVPAAPVFLTAQEAFAGPDDAAPAPAPAPAGPSPTTADGAGGARDGLRGGARRGPRARRHARARFLRSLDLSDAQRATLREARAAGAKAGAAAREKARAIRKEARAAGVADDAARASLRERLKAVRAEARAAVAPEAQKPVTSLTPEQRARLEARAKERGKTFDEARFRARVERALLRSGGRR